jgi:uncharacterized protein YndB with AHSA1/START domain
MMAPIVRSVELSRSAEDVFAYVTDISRATEWQENLVREELEGQGPLGVGSRMRMTRRLGRGERTMTSEMTEFDPPRSFGFRGIDGPVRAIGKGTVAPVGEGGSRFTMELHFEGHGIGKVLVPLVVRRQAPSDLDQSLKRLKARLESGEAMK